MIAHKQASNHITWIKHVANNELLLFVAIVLLINIDRLALGEYGLLGRIDLSDQYVNKTAFLAKYWLNPTAYAWDASILRGWPTFIGSLTPQHFGSLIGALVPIKLVYPIVLITTGYLVLSGAFLFVKRFLGCQRETALFGSFLFFGITYWYNENLVIVAVPLLPLLVAVTTIGKEKINSAIRFTSMILIATLIKITSKGSVLYLQQRMGLDGKKFDMLKFRTMKIDAEAGTGPIWANENDDRKTFFGSFLRKTSLDELPQLFNVLRGEMSLVGPRPERPVFVDQFRTKIPGYMLRHTVKAGVTGWAQINGWRGQTSLDQRIKCDLYYINHWSVLLDLKILMLTVFKGFINRNAY